MLSWEQYIEAVQFVKDRCRAVPKRAVILGSGFAPFAERLQIDVQFGMQDVPHGLPPSISGHGGKIFVGSFAGTRLVCVQGRLHYYEGHSMERVAFLSRVLAGAGVEEFILTNAAGGLRTDWQAGDLMLIQDHINGLFDNPLRGRNEDRWGPRFPDLSEVYDRTLRTRFYEAAESLGILLREGVYAGSPGPGYETPAEVRMWKILGADAVGMSTVPEAIALRHMGKRVVGLSCIANLAAGLSPEQLDHEDVLRTVQKAAVNFTLLLEAYLKKENA